MSPQAATAARASLETTEHRQRLATGIRPVKITGLSLVALPGLVVAVAVAVVPILWLFGLSFTASMG